MKLALSLIISLSATSLFAQNTPPCWFDTYQRQNRSIVEATEVIIRNSVQNTDNSSRASHNIRIIPVVVHVIHNGGVENISDIQVQSQIEVLNEDFRKIAGSNGDGNGVDTEIEFCLAKLSPDGHCTNGIIRVQSTLTNHLTHQRAMLKQLSYWDNTRYLNMYVVKSINGGSGIAGYSSFPGGPPDEDGIVVRYNYFGRTGTIAAGSNGRTTTHEISHWFGLYHTFNNGCGTDTCTDGDYICDTPPAASPNYGCPTVNSCSNDFPDLNDQIANYCDYSDDVCKSMFTAGQRDRMQATLNTIRTVIWSGSNLISTGCDSNYVPPAFCAPVANFVSLTNNICVGSSIDFMSNSLNSPATYNWFFDGGSPPTSSAANPIVTYGTVGTFGVMLVVSNTNGTDTLERLNYVTVDSPIFGSPNTWGDNFENANFPTNGLTIDNPDGGITWERTSDAAYEGVASARIQNFINTNYGQSDALLLPRFDFAAFSTPIKMVFKWAYARSDANYSDELIVLVSSDCGTNWTQKFYRTGTGLVTGPTQTTLFIPDSTQWKSASIDLSSYSINNHVDIKIVNVTDGGNALYIDSLKVGVFDFDSLPSAITNLESEFGLNLFPNPANNYLEMVLTSGQKNVIEEVKVFDVLGRTIEVIGRVDAKRAVIDTEPLKNGWYFTAVRVSGKWVYRKFLVAK